MKPFVFPLLALVVFAGCADRAPDPAPAPAAEGADPPRLPELYAAHGTTVVGVWARPVVPGIDESPRLWFNVTGEQTGIVVELAWNDTVQDLDARINSRVDLCAQGDEIFFVFCAIAEALHIKVPGDLWNDQGSLGDPDSPSRLVVTREEVQAFLELCGDPCHVSSYPWAQDPIVDVEWFLYVTVFYGEVPEDYTAIPWLK